MIYSMTGYSRATLSNAGFSVTVDIKSLNGRNLDVVVRFPKEFVYLENDVRQNIKGKLRRGRVEVFVSVEIENPYLKAPPIDPEVFRSYWDQLVLLSVSTPSISFPSTGDIVRIPYVFDKSRDEKSREIIEGLIVQSVHTAVDKLVQMRKEEGRMLEEACRKHLGVIENFVDRIEARRDVIVKSIRNNIVKRLNQLLEDVSISIDENRILQEAALLADRSDITEELVRLKSHIRHFVKLLSEEEPADGRKLDFLVQEMQREANTLGVKSLDVELSALVVELKTEIAKLREQVQNVE